MTVCKKIAECEGGQYNTPSCLVACATFLTEHDTLDFKAVTKTKKGVVDYYKICTGPLSDSDIAALFFVCGFVVLAFVIFGYIWWKLDRKKTGKSGPSGGVYF